MSNSIGLLPCCTQCSAVKAEGAWYNRDGDSAKTTNKLDACGRCHLGRYCNTDCQRGNWALHKVGCQASERVITAPEVDKMVQSVCKVQAGKVVLHLDPKKQVLSAEEFPEVTKEGKLVVDVKMQGKTVGRYTYLVCGTFNWKKESEEILHPPSGIHNPGALVTLGHRMIEKGLYVEAFQMMAEKTPQHYQMLKGMFFPQAVRLMHAQGASMDLIVSCAKLLNKNRSEVEVLIHPPKQVVLPKDLQNQIKAAEGLDYGARDVAMVELAKQIVKLGVYDQAFDLVFNWVAIPSAKTVFFRVAALEMIQNNVSYEKIVQLAKTIALSDDQILKEVVGIYALCNLPLAIQLSNKRDDYLEIVFSALVNDGKKEEARSILNLVSPTKRDDLRLFFR